MPSQIRNIGTTLLCFGFSTLITVWFIFKGAGFYSNDKNMLLSGIIAGGKWTLQILVAMIFLGKLKWSFIKRISFVCLAGSLSLFSYYPIGYLGVAGGQQFAIALTVAVVGMIIWYYQAVETSGISIKWFLSWIASLIVAIILQLTVVFHII